MKLQLLARDSQTEKTWKEELKTLQTSTGIALENLGEIVFVDAKKEGWQHELSQVKRDLQSVVLILEEKDFLPNSKQVDAADDLLVYPFRIAEVLSVYRHHQLRKAQHEIIQEVALAQEDVQNANEMLERMVQSKTPKRYSNIKGLHVMSKHLSGLKPGGDYFDVFESAAKDFVNVLLVDSSTYGISAAFLGMILSSSARMANDSQLSTADWVRAIYNELKITLGDEGHFSLFFGRLSRKDLTLRYQLFGTIEAFRIESEGITHSLQKNGKQVSSKNIPEHGFEKVVQLSPKDRIVLLSDGFVNGVGGEFHLHKIFQDRLTQEPFAVVNELSFLIKSKLSPGETFPGEDCSAIVLDIDSRTLRLAPTG